MEVIFVNLGQNAHFETFKMQVQRFFDNILVEFNDK